MNTVLLDAPTRTRNAPVALPTPAPGETLVLMSVDTPHWVDEHAPSSIARTRTQFRVKTTERGRVVVSEHHAEMRTGTARNGKTWAHWKTTSITTVEVLASGEWFIRRREIARRTRRPMWAAGTYVPRPEGQGWSNDGRLEITERLRAYAADFLPAPAAFHEAYPLAPAYLSKDHDLPKHLGPAAFRRAFRSTVDVATLTRLLFGTSRYRKDLVREVAQAHPTDLCLAWQFRGLVPVDWVIGFLRQARTIDQPGRTKACQIGLVRHHLRALDETSLRRLLRDPQVFTREGVRLIDSIKKWPAGPVGRVRSWEELHDRAYTYLLQIDPETKRPRKPRKPRKADLPEAALALNGRTTQGRWVSVAANEADLMEWGAQMHHCIGIYGRDLERGSSWLGAVMEGDTMIANFEIAVTGRSIDKPTGTLAQLLGKHNRTLDASVRRDIEAHLLAAGVTVPDDYWGSGR